MKIDTVSYCAYNDAIILSKKSLKVLASSYSYKPAYNKETNPEVRYNLNLVLIELRMKPPREPKQEDCCNSGCNPCIFDVYEQKVKVYKKYLEGNDVTSLTTVEDNIISQLEYTEFEVTATEDYCPAHKLIKFRHPKEAGRIKFRPGDHFLVKYFSTEPCTRAYSPVKDITEMSCENNEFIVIVKNCGLVSNYLCSLSLGEKIVWRGPYGSFNKASQFKNMVLITHGTGIASFMPIIHELLNDEELLTRIILYYCCKQIELILFRETLYSYQSYWNFKYKIFIRELINSSVKYKEPVIHHKLNYDDFDVFQPFSVNTQFLICGSNEFMNYYKSYLIDNGVEINNIVIFK